ncbi:unnamed protein product [Adineta ricciae]|uniref:Uncharacterized protein n=1 Tax=Adineta ricciae TaxID=249248 RepID=A0A815CII1_ADIRI|nr:unnamed protein product [Adineta ricciae]
MVCDACQKKVGRIATQDVWKSGSRNTKVAANLLGTAHIRQSLTSVNSANQQFISPEVLIAKVVRTN